MIPIAYSSILILIIALLLEIIFPSTKNSKIVKKNIIIPSPIAQEGVNLNETIIGRWGAIPLYKVSYFCNHDFVHPNDIKILTDYPYINCCHLCVGEEGDYLVVNLDSYTFRVLRTFFYPYSKLQFKPLTEVKFINSKGFLEYGKVTGMNWHSNRGEPIYTIEVNGKLKTRRYFDADLELVI